MKYFKTLALISLFSLINQSFAQTIQVNCGQCKLLKNCQTGNCISYTGASLEGVQECSTQAKCSTVKYPYFYFSQSCAKDTDGASCQYNCCVKLSTVSSAPKTCTDSLISPSKFCNSTTQSSGSNSGAIAGGIVGTLAGVFILIVLGCFIYHECYIKKKKMQEGAETQYAKSVRNEVKQKTQHSVSTKKKHIKPQTESTLKTSMSNVDQQRKKKGSIRSKKSRAEILQIYGKPQSKSQQPMEQEKAQNGQADS